MAAEPSGLRLAVFKVSYVAGDGAEHQVPLAEAPPVPFEQAMPVRRFAAHHGQRHLSGLMRPGWAAALAMSASRLPHARLLDIDARMQAAAARPVIVPDTIVIDGGKVFVSGTFTRACGRLGISVQRARPHTPGGVSGQRWPRA